MGHSDIETTGQYLDPDESLKRKAVNRLSLKLMSDIAICAPHLARPRPGIAILHGAPGTCPLSPA
jgi:hypothetical protein